MNRTVCPECGRVMYDDEHSIRFKCDRCGHFFEIDLELHEAIKKALYPVENENNAPKPCEKSTVPFGAYGRNGKLVKP